MNNKGFTLIELVVTLSLIIIIVGIAVPKINYDNSYLKSVTDELLYDIRDLRIKNMSDAEASAHEILFYDNNKYMFKNTNNEEVVETIILEADFEFTLVNINSKKLSFNTNGTPSDNSILYGSESGEIVIKKKDGSLSKRIKIIKLTGKIQLID